MNFCKFESLKILLIKIHDDIETECYINLVNIFVAYDICKKLHCMKNDL